MWGSYLKKDYYTTTRSTGLEWPQKLLLQSHPEINVIPPGPCSGLFWIHLFDLSSTIRSLVDFCTTKHELMRDGTGAISLCIMSSKSVKFIGKVKVGWIVKTNSNFLRSHLSSSRTNYNYKKEARLNTANPFKIIHTNYHFF